MSYPRKFRRKPYRTRRARRGRGGSRYTVYGSASYLAKKALWGLQKIRGLVNSEMYKYTQSQSGVSVTNSGGTIAMTTIAQGDGDGARTGNSILVKSLNIKGNLIYNTGASKLYQPVRLFIVMDTQQVGDSSPTIGNVLEQVATYGHISASTAGRFKVLYNRVFTLTGSNAGIPFQINIPLQHHVRYNGTASSDIQKGGLYFMYCSNESTLAPTMDYESRTCYHDN